MLRNYFKIAWRNLWKNKTFSLINILGLSLSIACALLIIFHVKEELGYDKGFSKADRIYRVTEEGLGNDPRHWAAAGFPLGTALQQSLPEVESIARFHRRYPYQLLSYTTPDGNAKRFQEKGGLFADSSAIRMFDFQFAKGDPATALSQTDAIVLTEKMAHKYFGDENPLGKTIQDERTKLPLKVTGVIKAFSFNTHLQFDYLLSMSTVYKYNDMGQMENRTWSGFYTYVLLRDPQSHKRVESKLPAFTAKFYEQPGQTDQQTLASLRLNLQPITAIHLHSKLEKELYPNSDITYVYIFSIAALLILLLAAVNFINVSTAQAFNRMKEIGLRKVIGATKPQLLKQFLGESFLTTLLATLLALLLFREAIPFYNELTDKNFHFGQLFTRSSLWLLGGLVVVIGFLAGIYPAWFVSSFNPVTSLKGKKDSQSSVHLVRKGLIIFQFAVSVFMIFSTIVVYRQTRLFHNKDLGFDKEQLVAITMYDEMWEKFSGLIGEMEKNPAILSYAITSTLPGERFGMQPFSPLAASGKSEDQPSARVLWSDDQLLTTLNVPLKQGRNFTSQFPVIKKKEFILNEAAVSLYKLNNPIGQRFVLDRDTGEVVGVARNFNFASLHSSVEPLVIQYNPFRANYLLLRIKPGQIRQTITYMESGMKNLYPASVFTYTFIDDKLDQLYASENRMSNIIQLFALFALFISALGLFGLSAYSIRLRTKEIGIRKTLGASVSNVALLLSLDFIKLVVIAMVIAWPVAWWASNKWLNGFAYRISIDWLIFLASGIFALLVGAATVSFEAVKAALLKPVKSLKTE
jgi:putative ABC transport system permease protein